MEFFILVTIFRYKLILVDVDTLIMRLNKKS